MNVTPCLNCMERYEQCHSFCKKYKDWRAELDAEKCLIAKVKYNERNANQRRNEAIAKIRNKYKKS